MAMDVGPCSLETPSVPMMVNERKHVGQNMEALVDPNPNALLPGDLPENSGSLSGTWVFTHALEASSVFVIVLR